MKRYQKYLPIITVLCLIAAWWIIAAIKKYPLLYPSPAAIFVEMIEILKKGVFYRSLLGSLLRVLISFSVAFILATALSVLSYVFENFERLLYPIILLVRATPTMCVIFLCVLWFKPSVTPMVVAAAVIFPTMYSSSLTAFKSCDKDLIEMSKLYEVPTKTMISKLYLPFMAERVYSDAVSVVSLNVKLIVAAEAIAQTTDSLGRLMQGAYGVFEIASLFAYTLAAIILSFLLETLLKLIGFLFRRRRYAETN